MSRAKDIEHRMRLEPFGNIAAMLEVRAQKHIESLSDVELAQMAESVNWSTSTNCWCMVYYAAKWLRPLVEQELRNRSRNRATGA